MKLTRRDLVKLGLISGLTAGFAPLAIAGQYYGPMPEKPLNILILGGTGFIGPHMVRTLTGRGHTVTLFNRGRSNPGLFPDIETLIGDRDGHLSALEGRQWDAVVDTSGYLPRLVGDSAALLADASKHYLFISTISVYQSFEQRYVEEGAALQTMDDTSSENIGEHYGALKALCEKTVEKYFPGRNTILRPGLIAGPGDHTDRITYWPVRVARGGQMAIPGDGTDYLQWVDARDLADFVVRCLERDVTGIYNVARPAASFTMGDMVQDSQVISGVEDFAPVFIPLDFLEAQGIELAEAFPVFVPNSVPGEFRYIFAVSTAAAFAKGLRARPAGETIADILSWWQALPAERSSALRVGITPEKETALISAWQQENKGQS